MLHSAFFRIQTNNDDFYNGRDFEPYELRFRDVNYLIATSHVKKN